MFTSRDNRTEYDEMRHGRRKPDRYIGLRNILNAVFMLGAIVGVTVYYLGDTQIGTIVILVSMLFKIVECVIRFMK